MHCGVPFNQAAGVPETDSGKNAAAFGWNFNPVQVAVGVVIAVAIYVVFFVLFAHPVHLPLRRLFYSYVGLSLSTACLVFVDAENLGTKVDVEGFPELTAVRWFLLTLCLWPVGFILYLLARAQFGEVKLIRAGLISSGIMVTLIVVSGIVAGVRSSIFFRSSRPPPGAVVRINGEAVSPSTLASSGKRTPVLIISSGTQVIRR